MSRSLHISVAIVLLLMAIAPGCSKSDDQKKFEDQAFSEPENYTAMRANGVHDETGPSDPDDWRISPNYQGLVQINTRAHPNPVVLNNYFEMDLLINANESVPGLNIWVFKNAGDNPYGPIGPQETSYLSTGLQYIRINSKEFAGTGHNTGLFRVIIMDGRDNVITYGDVMVQ